MTGPRNEPTVQEVAASFALEAAAVEIRKLGAVALIVFPNEDEQIGTAVLCPQFPGLTVSESRAAAIGVLHNAIHRPGLAQAPVAAHIDTTGLVLDPTSDNPGEHA